MPQKESTNEGTESRSSRRRPLLIVILAVLVLAISGGVYFFFFSGKNPGPAEANSSITMMNMNQFALESIIVNLDDPGLRRYLRTKITLEYSDPKLTSELEKKVYRIRDTVISVLRSKETNDLQNEKALKQELLTAINSQLSSGQVSGIFFEEFIIQ